MKNLKNKVAAVTGAGSGIGRSLALNLAARGCHLAIADINEDELKKTADMIKDNGINVSMFTLDVSDKEKVYEWADYVVNEHGQVDIIINNAGVAVTDSLEDISYENFEWCFNILYWGVVYGTKAFLPHLRKRPEANIVNISSINGMVPFPHNGPYNSAKYAVRGFNETLIQELRTSNIHVTSVHPGGIKTNLTRNMRFVKGANESMNKEDVVKSTDVVFRTTPDECAEKIVRAIIKNKKRLMVGLDAKFMDIMSRLSPVLNYLITGLILEKMSIPEKAMK